MNYIKHLTGFFERIMLDKNLNPTHVSLYIALFQFWNINRFLNPISISRDEVMRICKISSKATYHKCMRDLNNKDYIKYEPSYNPYKGSLVTLFDFSEYLKPVQKKENNTEKKLTKYELVMNKQETSSETSIGTSTEQALVSYINNTNIINNSNIQKVLNLDEQAKKNQDDDEFLKTEVAEKKEKSSAKKEKEFFATSSASSRAQSKYKKPSLEEVKFYFLQQNFPEVEANKFFNYFSSIGWLVGGKTLMVDWKAAAQNWMLNTIKFKSYEKPPNRAQHLNIENDKNYGEPL